MLKDVDLHQITWLLLIFLTTVTLFMAYLTSRKRKSLASSPGWIG
jgi:preprotein translocase subunit SecG